ncbi:MAG: heme lyase CcmF/NrfE family subunit [Ilumatobacteraceae bacterium]|nr:heme lyase CcmF/NrfE family subunit [Ilumatobacteraceae bacterium]
MNLRAFLGLAGLLLGLLASGIGIVLLAAGLRRRDRMLLLAGRRMVFWVLAGAIVAAGAMEWALISHDFELAYVASNGSRSTPLLYTVASMWGALEGSILLWALVLAGYLTAMVYRFRHRADDPLVAWATLVGLGVATFFFGLTLGPANPFRLVEGVVPSDGPGPNPLLQNHPLMAFHPPVLYLGYVGFTIPFAFALAALITGRVDESWLVQTRRATLVAWGALTAGIVLGGWWSYEVLGWGGYWAWDPVENASLLPWLTATAFLHSVVVQERRGMLRVWNLSLVVATFCLTIFGTFLTRSGVINSVHSFTQSPIGPALLGFLGVVTLTSVALIGWRAERLRSPGQIDSPWSREAAFLGNNLLFAAFAAVVLIGTAFPLLAETYDGRQISVGEPYFDAMTMPIGFALLFLMAVAPALPWRAASAEVLHRRLATPAWAAAGTMAIVVVLGLRGLAPVLAVGLGAFAVAGVVRQFAVGARSHRRSGAAWPRALAATVAGHRRLYGGLVVHVGVVVFALAFTMSSTFATGTDVALARGESTTFEGYRFTYVGSETTTSDQKVSQVASIRIERGERSLGVYEPAVTEYPNRVQLIGTPSVRTGVREDVYLTLVPSSSAADDTIQLGIGVNPLVVWLWVGTGVMLAGTALAAWPRRRRPRPATDDARGTGPAEPVETPTGIEPDHEHQPVEAGR